MTILPHAESYHSKVPRVRLWNPSAQPDRIAPRSRPNFMRNHIIRLRGGWYWENGPDQAAGRPERRVVLPLTWPAGVARRGRLVRPFQAPPLDPARESLGFQLDDVAGLVVVELNGRELARPAPGTTSLWLPLPPEPPLPRRNLLALEVEPPRRAGSLELDPSPWGTVALVICAVGL